MGITAPPHSASVPSPPPPLVRAARVGATLSRDVRRGGVFPDRRAGSSNSGCRLAQSPESRTMNTRSLRCARLKYCASKVAHSTSPLGPSATPAFRHPSCGTRISHPANSPTTEAKSRPPCDESSPGTFSATTHLAWVQSAILAASKKSPLLVFVPSSFLNPLRSPATLRSVQGKPKTHTFMWPSSLICCSVIFVTSPRLGTSGQRSFKTAHANGSISDVATHDHPSGCHATDAASIPLKSEMNLITSPSPRAPGWCCPCL